MSITYTPRISIGTRYAKEKRDIIYDVITVDAIGSKRLYTITDIGVRQPLRVLDYGRMGSFRTILMGILQVQVHILSDQIQSFTVDFAVFFFDSDQY